MTESRTKNSIRNVKTGFIVQLVNKIMAFIVRTIFIHCLNTEYLGVNGLFTNILTMLSFAELGIGTAIIYNMYKPVAKNDIEKIKSLMNLYKKSYTIIGIIIFVIGLCLIPFLDVLVKDVPNIKESITLIYLLFLINTSSSYFFVYKKSIIFAHQKQSIINNIDSIFYLIKSIIEIIILLITKNYILFLLIQIISTFIENVVISIKADKMYKYLKQKDVKPLEKKEKQNLFKNVKSLFIYQLGGIIMTGTDNILISALVNVATVGLCSNYVLIISSVKSIITSALGGVTASIGNLNASASKEKKEEIFYLMTFINYMVYSFAAIAFVVLLNPFIKLWLGENYVLNISFSIALALTFYIDGLRTPGYTYRTTLGLFEKGKITPYIGAITNIFFSIVLCKIFGAVGIFIATSVSTLLSYSWIDPYLIHKYEFKTPVKKYFKKYTIYSILLIINTTITIILTNYININLIVDLIIKGIIVITIPNTINIITLHKTKEFKEIIFRGKKQLKRG